MIQILSYMYVWIELYRQAHRKCR